MTPRRPARVAYQGEPGAYSEDAVRTLLGEGAEPVPRRSFQEVARSVADGETVYGLLPVENTLAGSVTASYDVLSAEPLEVVREVIRPIRHCLLGVPGAGLDGLERILSHPVALAQCGDFFRARPELEAVAVYDTAGAARRVSREEDPRVAAIAARVAGAHYGLDVLATDIQDRDDNQTRFYLVRRRDDGAQDQPPAGTRPGAGGRTDGLASAPAGPDGDRAWKSALLVRTDNSPGALYRVLRPLAERGVNLSKLESRPGADPWTYRFFLEFETRADTEPGASAVAAARAEATELRILGIFPRWNAEVAGPAAAESP